nr:hypothetical protein [Streptomyces sp. DSM 40484]
MPAIGDPIAGTPPPTGSHTDQIVVSVGPYMFHTPAVRSTNAPAKESGSASPPHNARRPGTPSQPSDTSICHVAGVACITVTPARTNSPANAPGIPAICPSATTTRAPDTSGNHNSSPAMSKPGVVTASSTSPAPSPGRSAIADRKLARLPCVTCTPFGRPVDPDVYNTYANWSPETATSGADELQAASVSTVCGSSSHTADPTRPLTGRCPATAR